MTTRHDFSRTHTATTKTPHPSVESVSLSSRTPSKMRSAEAVLPRGWSRGGSLDEAGSRPQEEHATPNWTLGSAPSAPQPSTTVAAAREQLEALLDAGWTIPKLAHTLGYSASDIHTLKTADDASVYVAEAIAEFPIGCGDNQNVAPTLGAWRRSQALTAMGWSLATQAEAIGWTADGLEDLGRARLMPADQWTAISDLYDSWSMTIGPDSEIMDQARRAGVTPPLGWDDDEIDHPDAVDHSKDKGDGPKIDDAAIERRLAGDRSIPLNRAERTEIIQIAIDKDLCLDRIAWLLDIERNSLQRTLVRWGVITTKPHASRSHDDQVDPVDPHSDAENSDEAANSPENEKASELDSGGTRSSHDELSLQLSLWGPPNELPRTTRCYSAALARSRDLQRRGPRHGVGARRLDACGSELQDELDKLFDAQPSGP